MWSLEKTALNAIKSADRSSFCASADQLVNFEAQQAAQVPSVTGKVATIPVLGVLTPKPDFFASFFGGGNTSYESIQAALINAENDASVTNIVLDVNGPGGTIAGLFETLAVIDSVTKPIEARVSGMAASATFAIVSKADTVVATSKATSFGSVGIVTSIFVEDDVVTITSSEAPNKRPDVTTDEGVEAVRGELDAIHVLFVEEIAEGRGTTAEKVNANFGQGGMFLAEKALERGMIDSISAVKSTTTATQTGGKSKKASLMDLETLRAQHPELFAQVVSIGEQKGVLKERDRVGAFAVAGRESGDMEAALQAIESGDSMTQTMQMKFTMAAVNRNSHSERQDDNAGTDRALNNSADSSSLDDELEKGANKKMLDSFSAKMGIDMEATH